MDRRGYQGGGNRRDNYERGRDDRGGNYRGGGGGGDRRHGGHGGQGGWQDRRGGDRDRAQQEGRGRDDRGGYHGGGGRGHSRGGGDRGRGGGRGDRGGGFDNRPQQSRVAPGGEVPLFSNYFRLKTKNSGKIYLYLIDWGPNVQSGDFEAKRQIYRSMRSELSQKLGTYQVQTQGSRRQVVRDSFIWLENHLFSQTNPEPQFIVHGADHRGQHEIKFSIYCEIQLDDLSGIRLHQIENQMTDEVSPQTSHDILGRVLLYFNIVVKHALRQKDYEQVGRFPKFFLANDQQKIEGISNQNSCRKWPGYELNTKQCALGIFLNVDACTKFITEKTVLEQFYEHVDSGDDPKYFFEEYNSSNIDNPRKVVICSHNSKSYQVDGMTKDFTPQTYRFQMRNRDGSQKEVTMEQYFFEYHKINLRDKNQPLLFVNRRVGDRIYLPIELCQEASLPKNFTKNTRDQQTLTRYKLTPQSRFQQVNQLIQQFQNDVTFQQWGVTVEQQSQEIKGKKLYDPKVMVQGRQISFDDINKNQLTLPLRLQKDKIGFIYDHFNYDLANKMLEGFDFAKGRLGMQLQGSIDDFAYVEVPSDQDLINKHRIQRNELRNGGKYIFCLKNELFENNKNNFGIQVLFVLLQREEDKPPIKKYLDQVGVISQFLLQSKQKAKVGERDFASVMGNILKQVNAKLSGVNWQIQLPPQVTRLNTMFVGLDVVQCGRTSIIGMAASSNLEATKYFHKLGTQTLEGELIKKSKSEQESWLCQDRTNQFQQFIIDALKNFKQLNKGQVPQQIIIYRDGVGGPTMQEHCLKLEGPNGQLGQAIQAFQPGYNPALLFMFVNKRVTTRFFERVNGSVINPSQGTVIDKQVVRLQGDKVFDFFMVANKNPTKATALPVHYEVVVNTTQLSKEDIEHLTYHQCYNYFGFQGPVKVPAAVMYAHKLAYYVLDNKIVDKKMVGKINPNLANNLYFL